MTLAFVTLHVGLGTFRPVSEEVIEDHDMHREFYTVSQEVADTINEAKKNGKRIVAVGTTSVRTLESASNEDGTLRAESGWTQIFIYHNPPCSCLFQPWLGANTVWLLTK